MAYLKILTGNQKGERYEIDRDRVVIGRSSKNVVCIEDPSVSGEHCAVLREGRKFMLQDLGSTNGTRLNGVTVTEYTLSPEDVVRVGAIELLFDGKDVDPRTEITQRAEDTQVTVRLDPTDKPTRADMPVQFSAKRSRNVTLYIVLGAIGVAVLGALAWFLMKLLG